STTVRRPAPAVAMIPPTDRESREPSIRNRCATERFTTERFTRHHAHPDTEDVVHTVDTRTPVAAEYRTSASTQTLGPGDPNRKEPSTRTVTATHEVALVE